MLQISSHTDLFYHFTVAWSFIPDRIGPMGKSRAINIFDGSYETKVVSVHSWFRHTLHIPYHWSQWIEISSITHKKGISICSNAAPTTLAHFTRYRKMHSPQTLNKWPCITNIELNFACLRRPPQFLFMPPKPRVRPCGTCPGCLAFTRCHSPLNGEAIDAHNSSVVVRPGSQRRSVAPKRPIEEELPPRRFEAWATRSRRITQFSAASLPKLLWTRHPVITVHFEGNEGFFIFRNDTLSF